MTAPAGEFRAAAGLVGEALAAAGTAVGDTHAAVARRVFTVTGAGRPRRTPARLLHDGISRGVYRTVEVGVRAGALVAGHVAAATAAAVAARSGAPVTPLADTRRGGVALGALNGAWGDRLAARGHSLALPMSLRRDRRDVGLTRDVLAAAYPDASGEITVWLHGLCETEQAWWLAAAEHWGDPASSHGTRLQALTGATPVYLRYNTGRHVSDNGEDLAELLAGLVERWPVPVTGLTLIGHSMGGLVIRAAGCIGEDAGAEWVARVRRVVYLGSPHLGAPLEVGAAALRHLLGRVPETAALGRLLASRSAGIKDLRHGLVRREEWSAVDLETWLPEPRDCAPLLADAEHYFIGVTLTSSPDTVAARILGDSLVTWPSASGRNRRRDLGLAPDRGRHLGRLHHFDLLNHPKIWEVLAGWLGPQASPNRPRGR